MEAPLHSSFKGGDINEDLHEMDTIEDATFEPTRVKMVLVKDAPSFPIGRLAKQITHLYENMSLFVPQGDTLTPDLCMVISQGICGLIKYPKRKWRTVHESLYPIFMGREIDTRMLYQMSVKIAGNMEYIKKHQVIPQWDLDVPVWAPVDIVACKDYYCKVPAKEIEVVVTAGIPAGGVMTQVLSSKFIQYMLREVGYPTFKVFDSQELYNTKFTAQIGRQNSKMTMMAFSVSSPQEKHNKELYKIRHGGCPFEYPIDCTICLNGLDKCPGAVHKRSYTVGDCDQGHRGPMLKDSPTCVACMEKARRDDWFRKMEKYKEKAT